MNQLYVSLKEIAKWKKMRTFSIHCDLNVLFYFKRRPYDVLNSFVEDVNFNTGV